MPLHLIEEKTPRTIAIEAILPEAFESWLSHQADEIANWIAFNCFTAKPGEKILLPATESQPARVLFLINSKDPWCWGRLPTNLPEGQYFIETALSASEADRAALAWDLGLYRFTRYKNGKRAKNLPKLVWPARADQERVSSAIDAIFLVRDLINTPAEDMGPQDLVKIAQNMATAYQAKIETLSGDALLSEHYPLIHAVGRASTRAPCLIDLCWGNEAAPKVTLVGKGVCFDSGGLDLKGAQNMKLMKKDMGGAAHVLGLACMIMDAKLPIRLRVLIPAVDNVVAGNAFRPMDILPSRKGLRVEIGNTDAEGRLVLADCLAEAASETPDLLVDIATLTGAARVALGPEIPALFTPNDNLAAEIMEASAQENDPLWRLPLWPGYRRLLDSKNADINNAPEGGFAGAITAALFLSEFAKGAKDWLHLDIMGWNPSSRPGHPEGGEAMGLLALFHMIARKYPL